MQWRNWRKWRDVGIRTHDRRSPSSTHPAQPGRLAGCRGNPLRCRLHTRAAAGEANRAATGADRRADGACEASGGKLTRCCQTDGRPNGAEARAGDRGPTRPAARVDLKFAGVSPALGWGLSYVANERGFFDEQNLNVEMLTIASSATVLQGMIGGEYAACEQDPAAPISAIVKGAPIKMVAAPGPGLNYVLVARKSINSLDDLAGRRIATGQPGSLPYIVFQALFDQVGGDMSRSQLVPVAGTPARAQAILAGQVDATVIAFDDLSPVIKDPDIKVLFNVRDKLPNYVLSAIFVQNKLLQEQPDVVVRLATSLTKAVRSVFDDADGSVKAWAPLVKKDPAEVATIRQQYVDGKLLAPDARITPAQIDYMQALNIKLGNQAEKAPFEELVDSSVMDKVLAALGPYKGRS